MQKKGLKRHSFTLIEVVVAIMIVVIIAFQFTIRAANRDKAAILAEAEPVET